MRKSNANYTAKKKPELMKEEAELRREIAKLTLEARANPQKDTNMIFKKRKQLAVLLTVMNRQTA
ncbi:50S ribosomal protein L29 [Candidatus Microgenomates bacterium]|nr:50S ribosomal protein L29 [Candidatus Microgenomates bacterium]